MKLHANAARSLTHRRRMVALVVEEGWSVSAAAADNVAVAGVQFKLDGSALNSEDTAPPYAVSWDTGTASNGSHTLTAVARDAAGNQTTSTAVTVTVTNDVTGPVISEVAASGITGSSATITWTTNETSDSEVEYGLTTAYGSSTTANPGMDTAHVGALTGLAQGRLPKSAALKAVAARHQATVGQVMLAWCLRHKIVFAVPKTSRLEGVRENAAAGDLKLTDSDLAEIDRDFPPPSRAKPLEML